MATVHETIDRARLSELIERERGKLLARTEGSQRYYERALGVMPRGVPSSFQAADPRPIYLSHGEGSHVWDVDGNEYVDFHNGFGVMCVGHANPAIVAAVSERAGRGSHFAAPTEGSIVVAEELARRFGLPQWRFTNSGTESTMDAIHLAAPPPAATSCSRSRAPTTATTTPVMVSVRPPLDQLGERGAAGSVPFGAGHPRAVSELTKAIPFNDADLLERVLDDIGDQVAAPDPRAGDDEHHHRGAQAGLPRARARAHRQARRRARLRRGQDGRHHRRRRAPSSASASSPTSSAWPRRSPAATPAAPSGMTETLADLITTGNVRQVGTFNGNPLSMAAAQAALTEVLTAEAYAGFEERDARLRAGSTTSSSATACRATRSGSAPRAASSSPPSRCTSTATTRPRWTRSSRRCRGCTT
jgi:glutamate-1-semialdehyde 2,1-aminomutase